MTSDGVFGQLEGHEQVVYGNDPATGLRAIVGIHSTALGPALGGTRFFPYPTEEAALTDVLHLSRAMSYKNALAGLDHGGGKAVIIGDPTSLKTTELLLAYGRLVESLGGRYITACDVGTYVADMDVIAQASRFVTGRSEEHGGAGDSSELTAFGVFQGMRAAAQHLWGEPTLAGRRVGISGVGKVGRRLVGHLLQDDAEVVIFDVNRSAIEAVTSEHPAAKVASSHLDLLAASRDVYSPNALGGALNDEMLPQLVARLVCGGANNQLAHPGVEEELASRGILYAPDFLVNAGGVIQVADELVGFSHERARARVEMIFQTTLRVLSDAVEQGIPPAQAADRLAEDRIAAAVSRTRGATSA
ncbi:MAG TPA: Glu/Leu/Phe/Val dehydrogenase dimerization domain-containing protein [Actinomycetes bacterium]|nr:Glu/Leu/Phe/Val dehydrogenase dimerization domain-containing protein [Actinomycetes bacterium]